MIVRDDDLEDDRVRDDEYARDTGDTEPADPLGQAMPDMTEAHLAEAGGPRPQDVARSAPPVTHEHHEPAHGATKNIFARAADFLRAS